MTEDDFNLAFRLERIEPPCGACLITSPALRKLADIWFAAGRAAALRDAVKEWEKPYGLSDGRNFIDRLRTMS